jgi:hypothetical protein
MVKAEAETVAEQIDVGRYRREDVFYKDVSLL